MGVIQTKIKQTKFQVKLKNKERINEKKTPESSPLTLLASSISSRLSVKFPSTNDDIDFLHQHHFVFKSIWLSNFSSPINDILNDGGAKILDVLCGAGTFLLELSNEHRNSEFFGVDKSNIFPSEIKPNNLTFVSADLLNGLPFEDNYFDFVHLTIAETIYTLNHWDNIVKELLRVTKPGGCVEIQGFDFLDENIGPKFMQFIGYYVMLFETTDFDMKPRNHIRSLFSANFETSHVDDRSVLLSKKGGNLGLLLEQHATMFFRDTIGGMIAELINVNMDEYGNMWNEALKEFSEFDTILDTYRIWGTKKDDSI